MKTLEEVNGHKVWAVEDSFHTHGCGICMFRNGNGICLAPKINCLGKYYIPHEEEKEKTFTLSQINEILFYFVNYYIDLHGIDKRFQLENRTIVDEFLKQKLEQL